MITFEVAARYVFNAPTIWAEEMSRFVQIWATYLAAATLLRSDGLIRITLVVDRLGERLRQAAQIFSLLVVAGFSAVAVWYGGMVVLDSIVQGRATSTMLSVPQWATESAIPLGFSLLILQCLAQIARIASGQSTPGGGPQGRDAASRGSES